MKSHCFRKMSWLIVFCLLWVWMPPSTVFAGRMVIQPIIETHFRTDSNFHRAENRSQTVYTYGVKPGIDIGYTTDKSMLGFRYDLDILKYDDQDDVGPGQKPADEFDYVAHNGSLYAQTQMTDKLFLSLDNTFMKTRDPASADVNANAVDRFKYTINRFNPALKYQVFDRLGIGLGYQNLFTDYQDDGPGQGEDSMENRGTVTFFYHLNSLTMLDLDYQHWERDYDRTTSDYTSNQLMANISRQFNFLTFSAGAGFHQREFDKSVPGGDIETFVWEMSVTGQDPDSGRSSVNVSLSQNLNDAGNEDTYFTSTRLGLDVRYQFTDRITGTLSGYYQNADYETANRDDDRWLVSLAGSYFFNDYFTAGLEGGYEERDSDNAGRNFDNTYLMVNIRFNYDLRPR